MDQTNCEPFVAKHKRKRKKQMLNSIREQIEFYFSNENLRHDKYMANLVKLHDTELRGTDFVPVQEFLKFNKIAQLKVTSRDIVLAIETSQCLELDQLKEKVRRTTFYVNKTNSEKCQIYVEKLPLDVDHNWVKSNFSCFGVVEYVSLPRFKHNNNIMGFAFVEFDSPEAASRACRQFGARTADEFEDFTNTCNEVDMTEGKQMKRVLDTEQQEDTTVKRIKLSPNNCDSSEHLKCDFDKSESLIKEKKKKKRKRRQNKEMKLIKRIDPEAVDLRVMSKREWKGWKKEYLKLQKDTMSKVKASLMLTGRSEEVKTEKDEEIDNSNGKTFTSGLIIKLKFIRSADESFDETQFKHEIRSLTSIGSILYIELANNQNEFIDDQTLSRVCYIRCKSKEVVDELTNEKLKKFGEFYVLHDDEEESYWKKISDLKKQRNKKNIRGFDKLVNKSERIGNKFF